MQTKLSDKNTQENNTCGCENINEHTHKHNAECGCAQNENEHNLSCCETENTEAHNECCCENHSHEEHSHQEEEETLSNCDCERCNHLNEVLKDTSAKPAAVSELSDSNKFSAFFKKNLTMFLGALVFIAALFTGDTVKNYLMILAYILIGLRVLYEAGESIIKGKVFSETLLMSIATIGAIILGDYTEAAAVMLFYRVGESLSDYAADRSLDSIKSLLELKSAYADKVTAEGTIQILCEDIKVGDLLSVKPGGQLAADGILTSDYAYVDTKSVTGEPEVKYLKKGDNVFAGYMADSTALLYEATAAYEDSMLSKMIYLTKTATKNKAKAEKFITKFAKWYTPLVVLIAVLIAVIPAAFGFMDIALSAKRALILLVISCPCALVLSIPLCSFAGIGAASKKGVLIKGANYLDLLSSCETAVFDKTGTLTKGEPKVTSFKSEIETLEFIEYMYAAEYNSNHPLAKTINAYILSENPEFKFSSEDISDFLEEAGKGVSLRYKGKEIRAGNAAFTASEKNNLASTSVYLSVDNKPVGFMTLEDTVKSGTKEAISALRGLGVKKTVMLTGDNRQNAEKIAEEIGIDEVKAELLPDMKVDEFNKVRSGVTIFAGDGINDSPVIAASDVGIAMGALGSDAAIEAADVVIMSDNITGISDAIKTAKRTKKLMVQNIVFVLAVKTVIMVLGALGYAGMMYAIFADVGTALIATLNSMRVLSS